MSKRSWPGSPTTMKAGRSGIVAIGSNDAATYPDDAPDKLAEQAVAVGFTFPYCYDETQEVARSYFAACTPDFLLFDQNHRLVYRGRLDESRPGSGKPVTGSDLRAALDAVLAGKPPAADQHPSMGCGINGNDGDNSSPCYIPTASIGGNPRGEHSPLASHICACRAPRGWYLF